LSGSYLPTDGEDGGKQRTRNLSVSLAGSDGRVFGGGVAGMLTAASPIQVVCPLHHGDNFLLILKIRFNHRKLSIRMFFQLSVMMSGLLFKILFVAIFNVKNRRICCYIINQISASSFY